MASFSVIIPVYNRASVLKTALRSVLNQEHPAFEVIVVDDGSTEDLAGEIREFLSEVTLLRQRNRGPGAARNLGAQHANGEYLAFLDSDDVFFPWTLSTYAAFFRERPRICVVLGKPFSFTHDEQLSYVRNESVSAAYHDNFFEGRRQSVFFGSYFAIARGTFLDLGGFEERIRAFEDQDLGLRFGTRGRLAVVNRPPTFGYRETDGSLSKCTEDQIEGLNLVVSRECEQCYGQDAYKWHRRAYISRSIRSVSVGLVRQGKTREACALYWRSFLWHIRLLRFRYLIGFPLLLTICCFRGAR